MVCLLLLLLLLFLFVFVFVPEFAVVVAAVGKSCFAEVAVHLGGYMKLN